MRVQRPDDWPRGLPSEDYVVQALLTGQEYTINVFFDSSGQPITAIPHRRIAVRAGEVAKGTTERHRGLLDLAAQLGVSLSGARGPLCFQAIVPEPSECGLILEINARFGGGFPLAHRAGARFTQWLLEEVLGWPSSANHVWQDCMTMLRYDQSVFVPADASG
jgi:carbamoyl-phosphate synthase large subunit